MKTAVIGSQTITDWDVVATALKSCGWEITEVLCGTGRGVEQLAADWAAKNRKPVHLYVTEESRYGRTARRRRDDLMVDHAQALVVIWSGFDREIRDVIHRATSRGIKFSTVVAHE